MRRVKRFGTCVLVLLAALSGPGAVAQRRSARVFQEVSEATLRCRVLLPSGAAAGRGIRVTLNTGTSPVMTLFSDKNGEVRFTYLRPGNYSVDVLANPEQFDPVSQNAVVLPGSDSVVSVYLREKDIKEARPRPAVASVDELDASVPAQARKEYERGSKLVKKGDTRGAIRAFERAVEIYPEFQKAHNDLGVQYLRVGRKQAAADEFALAIKLDPKAFNPRFNLGLYYADAGDHARAIDELERAVALDDSRPGAHLYLGISLAETGEFDAARKHLETTLVLGQKPFVAAYYYLGLVYDKLGNRGRALECLTAYLARAPKGEFAEPARDLAKQLAAPPGST